MKAIANDDHNPTSLISQKVDSFIQLIQTKVVTIDEVIRYLSQNPNNNRDLFLSFLNRKEQVPAPSPNSAKNGPMEKN